MFETYNLKVFGNKEGIKYNAMKKRSSKEQEGDSILQLHENHQTSDYGEDRVNKKLMN